MTNDNILQFYSIPENFWKLYNQYQELLTVADVAGFYQENFDMMCKQKEALEVKYYKDLSEFAEWCSRNKYYYYEDREMWYGKDGWKTTSDLQIIWEIETGRREK